MRPAARSRAQRKADTLASLQTEVDCWVASADEMGNAHLVPLSHYWDGAALVPYAFEGISTWLQRLDRFAQVVERTKGAR